MERAVYSPFSKEIDGGLDERKRERYTSLVLRAKEASAYPHQSGYFVRTAGLAKDGTEYIGGNKEYAHSDAFVHGETAVLSGMKDITDSPMEAIAWYRREGELVTPESLGRPCGNCRDVMRAYCSPELVLLNGNETGIVYTHLSDFLFEDFSRIDVGSVRPYPAWSALHAARRAVDVYLPEDMKSTVYGAALEAEDGTIWQGIQYTNVGYDAITPVMSAVINWMNSYPSGHVSDRHLRLKKLVIASEGGVPSPFYRDRQAILELDEILRIYTGNPNPLRVEIIQAKDSVRGWAEAVEAFETNVEEMLPHPFSPGAFRMDDVMMAQLVKLIGENDLAKIMEKRS